MKNKTEKKVKRSASKEDIRNLLLHLESEYRKANISEKHYKEMKEKYKRVMKDFEKKEEKKVTRKPVKSKIHDIEKIEKAPEKIIENDTEKEDDTENHLKNIEEKVEKEMSGEKSEPVKDEKKGFFKSLFGGKKQEVPESEGAEPEKNEANEEKSPEVKETTTEKKGGFKLFGNKGGTEKEEKKGGTEKVEDSKTDPPKKDKKKEKEEEISEITPEVIEKLARQAKEQSEGKKDEENEVKEKKGGFLKSITGKKKQESPEREVKHEADSTNSDAQPTEVTSEANNEASSKEVKSSGYDVEIEKIKVMLDTVKETGRVTDDTVRNISESVGEIRSMVFQADAEMKENAIKMEKIEDEISEVKPQEISKKFREYGENFEKLQLQMEMLEKKASDAGEKINKVLETLKSIGGIENLINVNKDVQKKLDEIKEVSKYIERIGSKTEKIFVDLNKGLQDLVIIRSQQEDFNESLKDMVKNIDSINVKFEGYVTKKDLEAFREDDLLIKKQIEDIKKILPVADLKLPEIVVNLRKEREDIRLLLGSLDEQHDKGKILKTEYESIKEANNKRLEEIGKTLQIEWKRVEKMIKPPEEKETVPTEPVKETETKEEVKEKPIETADKPETGKVELKNIKKNTDETKKGKKKVPKESVNEEENLQTSKEENITPKKVENKKGEKPSKKIDVEAKNKVKRPVNKAQKKKMAKKKPAKVKKLKKSVNKEMRKIEILKKLKSG